MNLPLNIDFSGKVVVITGAGGNNPRATTDNEYQHEASEGQKTFFDLDADGVDFVFKLNFQGTLIPTQVFAVMRLPRDFWYQSKIKRCYLTKMVRRPPALIKS